LRSLSGLWALGVPPDVVCNFSFLASRTPPPHGVRILLSSGPFSSGFPVLTQKQSAFPVCYVFNPIHPLTLSGILFSACPPFPLRKTDTRRNPKLCPPPSCAEVPVSRRALKLKFKMPSPPPEYSPSLRLSRWSIEFLFNR